MWFFSADFFKVTDAVHWVDIPACLVNIRDQLDQWEGSLLQQSQSDQADFIQ